MMTATKCPNQEQLRAFGLGQLAGDESDDLIAHVGSCEMCQSELETVDNAEDSLIASLRTSGELDQFQSESDCQLATAKALGALAHVGDANGSLDSTTELPDKIGEYNIVRPLGRGGMGNVYLAKHTKLGREVALKVLAHHRLGDKRVRDRFEVEMQAVGRLSHPNIVTAYDAREISGTAVLITEFIDGFDLGQLVKRIGPLSIADACEIVRQVAVALQYTSDQGFVHRDVKPSNIMLSRTGQIKLLDLGLARIQLGDDDRPDMTGTGQAMGTADFIAPEQVADSRSVDVRADIYSLGCTLFKLLTGRAPFEDEQHSTAFAKMSAHVSTPAPSLSEQLPNASPKLVRMVDSMLAKDASRRPQTPIEVAKQLAAFSSGNELPELVKTAEQTEPRANATKPFSSTRASAEPQPFLRRKVPMSLLIATGLASVLFGFAMGIVVKITYPDGTTVTHKVPEGGSVEVGPDESEANRSTSNVVPAALSERLQGKWLVDTALSNGVTVPTDSRIEGLAFRGSRFFMTAAGHEMDAGTFTGKWRASDRFYTFDFFDAGGSHKGILRFLDDDSIQWCMNNDQDGERPKQFVSEADWPNDSLMTLHREKSTKSMKSDGLGGNDSNIPPRQVGSRNDAELNESIEGDRWASLLNIDEMPVFFGIISKQEVTRVPMPHDPGGAPVVQNNGIWCRVQDGVKVPKVGMPTGSYSLLEVDIDSFIPWSELSGHLSARSNGLEIDLSFDETLSETMKRFTKANLNRQLAVVVNGKIITAPTIASVISDRSRLSGNFNKADLRSMMMALSGVGVLTETMQNDADNNLRQFGLAILSHEAEFDVFPASAEETQLPSGQKPKHPFSWRVAILPFIGEPVLYAKFRFDEPWDSEHNSKLLDQMPDVFRSPFAPDGQKPGETNYVGFVGEQSLFGKTKGIRIGDVEDGTSGTLMVVETKKSVPWTKPEDLPFSKPEDAKQVVSLDGKTIRFVTVDGSARSIAVDDWEELAKMITRNGAEKVNIE